MHGEVGILDGDEDGEGPEDEGEDPHDVLGRGRDEEKNCRQRIDGARADIAKDKSHGLDYALHGKFLARHFFLTSY